MPRTRSLFVLSAPVVLPLVGLTPAQRAQAAPPRQAGTATAASHGDDRGLTVQYVERVCIELHPDFASTETEEQSIRNRGEVDDDD